MGEDYNVLDDPIIKSYIESCIEEIESITQEDIDSYASENDAIFKEKAPFWKTVYSNWKTNVLAQCYVPKGPDKVNIKKLDECYYLMARLARYYKVLSKFGNINSSTTDYAIGSYFYNRNKWNISVGNDNMALNFRNIMNENGNSFRYIWHPNPLGIASYYMNKNFKPMFLEIYFLLPSLNAIKTFAWHKPLTAICSGVIHSEKKS